MKSASFAYKNMSARRGAQFVPIGMLNVCWKTFSAKTTKILLTKKLKQLDDVIVGVLVFRFKLLIYKICFYSLHNTKYLYLRLPFLKMKAFWIILANVLFSISGGVCNP